MKTFKKLVHSSCRCGRTDRQSNLQPRLVGLLLSGHGAVVAAVRALGEAAYPCWLWGFTYMLLGQG